MSSAAGGGQGWHPDPTGRHQLRYFDGGWTGHVVDNGVQAVSPMPVVPSGAPRSGGRRKAWWIGGAVVVGLVAVLIAVGASSSGGGSGGDSASRSFCDDFTSTWSIVQRGLITADVLVNDVGSEPVFNGADIGQSNDVNQAAQDASVIAKEAPSGIKARVVAISDYLTLAVDLAKGDKSVIGKMTRLNTGSETGAELLGSVPTQYRC